MVDALASGASIGNDVEVRVLSWAPANPQNPYLYDIYMRQKYGCVPFSSNLCTVLVGQTSHLLKDFTTYCTAPYALSCNPYLRECQYVDYDSIRGIHTSSALL